MTTRWRRSSAAIVALGLMASACTRDSNDAVVPEVETTGVPETGGAPTNTPPITATATAAAPTTATADEGIAADTSANPPSTIATPAATVPAACGAVAIGVTEFTLAAGGADHPVRVFVPSTFEGDRLAAVLNWHGLGGNGPDHAAVTSYEALAEAEGFIVIHPTGVPDVGDTRNSWQLDTSVEIERDDVAFAEALVDLAVAEWCVDAQRVYSTGMSNGGFFTARLVCELADRLAAASSVGGLYHPDGCVPTRPVPYIAYHGTDDVIVPFDGNGESVLLAAGPDPAMQVFALQNIPEEFAEFAGDAGCTVVPDVGTIGEVIRYDYSGCTNDIPMSFFEVTGGGHTWPNWPIAGSVGPAFGYTTTDVDATVDSWEFFRQHTRTD